MHSIACCTRLLSQSRIDSYRKLCTTKLCSACAIESYFLHLIACAIKSCFPHNEVVRSIVISAQRSVWFCTTKCVVLYNEVVQFFITSHHRYALLPSKTQSPRPSVVFQNFISKISKSLLGFSHCNAMVHKDPQYRLPLTCENLFFYFLVKIIDKFIFRG